VLCNGARVGSGASPEVVLDTGAGVAADAFGSRLRYAASSMANLDGPGGEGKRRPNQPGFHAGLVLDGRYRLERPLAEGGMGSVWVAHQITLEREVAVKVLRVAAGPARARLQREALSLAAVHHPAIVEIYDYGETAEGTPYLVMELVRGETVGARLHREGALPTQAAVALVLPLLEGLAVAHRAGVVHRDIKPDNVVLTAGATGVSPKLLDFGIARLDRAGDARLTAEGGFLGTPAYMAPEQVKGAVADERADVWGVGALLYELVTARAPFGHEDLVAVIRRVLDEPPSYPREARDFDGKLWGILMAALRKEPGERTSTALAFHAALSGWLASRSGGASPRSQIPAPAGSVVALSMPAVSAPAAAARLAPTLLAEGSARTEPAAVGRSRPVAAPTIGSAKTEPGSGPSRAPPAFLPDEVESIDALIRAKFGQS